MSQRARTKKRETIKRLGAYRVLVRKSNQNIYCSLINPAGKMMVTVSSLSAELKDTVTYGGNIAAASHVGKLFAKSALKLGVKKIAFDCGGNKYHGRVKSLAEGAREGGLEF